MNYRNTYNRKMHSQQSRESSSQSPSLDAHAEALDKNERSEIRAEMPVLIRQEKSKNGNLEFLISLINRVDRMEQQLSQWERGGTEMVRKKKKMRRRAREVPRVYKCGYGNCEKEYGSITSLKNHRKLKHGVRITRTPNENTKRQQ